MTKNFPIDLKRGKKKQKKGKKQTNKIQNKTSKKKSACSNILGEITEHQSIDFERSLRNH